MRLQAISQDGLVFATNPWDVERYEKLRDIAAELIAAASSAPADHVRKLFEMQSGEATPKVDVRAVVAVERRLLFVRQALDGLWSLPGGWADVGESPTESVIREVREEAGLAVTAVRLIGVYDRARRGGQPAFPFHVYKLFIECRPETTVDPGASLQGDHEVLDARFFPRDELPPLSLSRVVASEIEDVFEHLADPSLPPTCD
jgi:ADP-ribose pyrophosphatase YjhB (NUDIX family)